MNREGPPLELLLRRLVDTPADFMAEPRLGTRGEVWVAALVNDLLHLHRSPPAGAELLERFGIRNAAGERNRLALAMITVWLLADDWFVQAQMPQGDVVRVLDEAVAEMAASGPAARFVTDPDHREELARTVLARLDRRPAGETVAQASDRLSALSLTERRRLLAASRQAQERARAVREALVRKAAEESADKWTRE